MKRSWEATIKHVKNVLELRNVATVALDEKRYVNTQSMMALDRFLMSFQSKNPSLFSESYQQRRKVLLTFWFPEASPKDIQTNELKATRIFEELRFGESPAFLKARLRNVFRKLGVTDDFIFPWEKLCIFPSDAETGHSICPLLNQSVEKLRRYGIFIIVEAPTGRTMSLSKPELESIRPSPLVDEEFYARRGLTPFRHYFMQPTELAALHDAVSYISELYDNWRGQSIRTGVTLVFSFPTVKILERVHSIAPDGCIIIAMEAIKTADRFLFSLSASQWRECQDLARMHRHEDAPVLDHLQHMASKIRRLLQIREVFLIPSITEQNDVLYSFTDSMLNAAPKIRATQVRYDTLRNPAFSLHVTLRVSRELRVARDVAVKRNVEVSDNGCLIMDPSVSVEQVLRAIRDLGGIVVERALHWSSIKSLLCMLRKDFPRLSVEIGNSLRQDQSAAYLSCFKHFLESMEKIHSELTNSWKQCSDSTQILILVQSEKALLRHTSKGVLEISWNASCEEMHQQFRLLVANASVF